MNWLAEFGDFFRRRRGEIDRILDAGGCRELWLQGAIFLDVAPGRLRTNHGRRKYDLACQDPPMVAEIKLCGGDYSPKMKNLIAADVARLERAEAGAEKFMILVIDDRHPDTALGRWLKGFRPTTAESCEEVAGRFFVARIWRLK